jgi:glycerol uptake facilitator-like aquaporin
MKSEKIYWWMTLFFSELFASVFLLFLGCLSAVDKSPYYTPTHLSVSLAFGLAVMIGINSFSVSSGGFMSPIIVVYCYINKLLDIPVS